VPYPPLALSARPRVGFCGLLSHHRVDTLNAMISCDQIEHVYIIRNSFMGGDPYNKNVKMDFEQNMMNTHFNVCNRGAGNFSIRFYQTLAAGRIPVVLNTDMVLPLDIEWSQYIVFEDTNEKLVAKILEFWQQGDIEARQQRCYELWLKIKGMQFL
jgi:hypothetical protein